MTGGPGADTFVFAGAAIAADTVTDFTSGTDTLRLDDALWGGAPLGAAGVISTYGSVSAGALVLDFSGGNSITLQGLSTLSALDPTDIEIF